MTASAHPRRVRLRGGLADALAPWRLLLAAKAAVATGAAWAIGPMIPGSLGEYSYYAPLGALVSMTPTLMSSIRTTAQTALALAVGVALAWGVIAVGEPPFLSVPLAVGVGVLVAGFRPLGPARDYAPIAALFVLVIGGSQPGAYSFGYIGQMAVGMAIGVAVNLLIVPPLYLKEAAGRISSLRRLAHSRLADIAAAVRNDRLGEEDWRPGFDILIRELDGARKTVDDAWESRRANPRSKWHRYDMQEDYDDLRALGRIGTHILDVGESLTEDDGSAEPLPDRCREPLAGALEATARLVRAWDERRDEQDAAADAREAVERLAAVVGEGSGVATDERMVTIVFDLRRVVRLVRNRLRSVRSAA